MMTAFLLGKEPEGLDFLYTNSPPYDAGVIGSLSGGQLLHFDHEPTLTALAQGKPDISMMFSTFSQLVRSSDTKQVWFSCWE